MTAELSRRRCRRGTGPGADAVIDALGGRLPVTLAQHDPPDSMSLARRLSGQPQASAWRSATRKPHRAQTPWIKARARMGPGTRRWKGLVRREGFTLSARKPGCPHECWEDREATFLIGGEQCTRRCDFCQIGTGKPAELDRDEPRRVAESVAAMGLRFTIWSPGPRRDDLLTARLALRRKPRPRHRGTEPVDRHPGDL